MVPKVFEPLKFDFILIEHAQFILDQILKPGILLAPAGRFLRIKIITYFILNTAAHFNKLSTQLFETCCILSVSWTAHAFFVMAWNNMFCIMLHFYGLRLQKQLQRMLRFDFFFHFVMEL